MEVSVPVRTEHNQFSTSKISCINENQTGFKAQKSDFGGEVENDPGK
jgi:hypothetical protein